MSKKKTKAKKQQIKTKFDFSGQYLTIPHEILDNKALNSSDKMIASYIHSLYNGSSDWVRVSSKKLSELFNIKISTVNRSIRTLDTLEIIEFDYYSARKRQYKSLIGKTKGFGSMITSDLFNNKDITNTYKITLGVFIASSIGENNTFGGFNYNSIEEIAERLDLHVSSVYRHLSHLTKMNVLEPKEYADYTLYPKDSYVKHVMTNNRKQVEYDRNLKIPDDENDFISPDDQLAIYRLAQRL